MRITYKRYLSVVVIVVTQVIFIVNAECDSSYNDPNPSTSNDCFYPACTSTSLATLSDLRCVHDRSFCEAGEVLISADELFIAGRECTCQNILDFPKLVGTCLTNGVYSPMLTADDCVDGTPVCNADSAGKYLIGDTLGPFTACDLKCDVTKDHHIAVQKDTYKGCSFPKFDWTVASKSEFNALQAHRYGIVDDKLYIAGNIEPLNKCYLDGAILPSELCPLKPNTDTFPPDLRNLLVGPFNELDPTSQNGGVISDTIPSGTGVRCAIAIVDKNTGEPTDFFMLSSTTACYISAMGTHDDTNRKAIVVGGHHAAGGQLAVENTVECTDMNDALGNASITCKPGPDGVLYQTIIKAHDSADTAFVLLMDSNDLVSWVIQPWLALIASEDVNNLRSYNSYVTDSSVDRNGDVYISGYRIDVGTKAKYAMISKHSGTDGSIIWEEEFPGVGSSIRLVEDASKEAVYVTLQVSTSTTVLGITCDPPSPTVKKCSVLARVSANDGSVQWARYAYGDSDNMSENGEVRVAHPDDGPYVYVTFYGGENTDSPSELDLGTSYSGCEDSTTGTKTIETDPIFSSLRIPLNPTGCLTKNLGTYFDRTSVDAVSAQLANTHARCNWTPTGKHCLAKYHKLTGLPIWGSVTPLIQDFTPLADGIVTTGSKQGLAVFDTVEVSAPVNSGVGTQSVVYQSKIDLDGMGVYVQPIIAHNSDATRPRVTHDSEGDVYVGFSTEASKTYLGPGLPVGFVQDLKLNDDMCEIGDSSCTTVSRVTVAKLGAEEVPNCIDSCGDSGNVIKADMCYIDQVCYNEKDNGSRFGFACHVCKPSISQTSWTLPSVGADNFCLIDNMCYRSGDFFTVDSIQSKCQVCKPVDNVNKWSLNVGSVGYERTFAHNPPFDCIKKDKPISPPILVENLIPLTFAPTPQPTHMPTVINNDIRSGLSSAAVNGIVLSVLTFAVALYFAYRCRCCCKKSEYHAPDSPPVFFPVEGDLA